MLTSLFGELRSLRAFRAAPPLAKFSSDDSDDSPQGFAATAIMKSPTFDAPPLEPIDRSLLADNPIRDLVVSGSAALAIRQHFEVTRADMLAASRQITLLDLSGAWAPAIIKALSEASGKPVERLHLREQGTLRTLAMIERTVLERHNEEPLRIYHADVRAQGSDNQAIPDVLMEHSHMTAVILGAISPQAVDDLLCSMYKAVQKPQWRCPTVLFMLPPGAVWISNKIAMIDWPRNLRVQTVNESYNNASAVWSSLLGMWNRAKLLPALAHHTYLQDLQSSLGLPIKLSQIAPQDTHLSARASLSSPSKIRHSPLGIKAASESLRGMLSIEGMMGCAVVDTDTGLILARQVTEIHPFHLDSAAARGAQVLRAHYQAAQDMGAPTEAEEITTCSGGRYHVVRTSAAHPGLFLFALLKKEKSNLALARYKLMEAEHSMV
jgi:hypothetical protein